MSRIPNAAVPTSLFLIQVFLVPVFIHFFTAIAASLSSPKEALFLERYARYTGQARKLDRYVRDAMIDILQQSRKELEMLLHTLDAQGGKDAFFPLYLA